MYLANFFHRPPGGDDRELLFIPDGDPMIIGIHMDRTSQPESDELRAIVTKESVLCTHPKEARAVLQNTLRGKVG